jgi:tetratricopeptide (TPR) repeat protein
MAGPILFFFAALAVRDSQTPLRSGCGASDQVITSLPAGTPVEIRFRLADGSDCIKVAASVDNQSIIGYVSGAALAGLDTFEKERSSARSADPGPRAELSSEALKFTVPSSDPELERATKFLSSNEPEQALELLEPAAKRYKNNSNVLLLAGLAAYRVDQLDTALGYWKQSLDLTPNDRLAGVYERVQREANADRSVEKLVGMHIVLRYQRDALSVDTARAILGTLDTEYSRVSGQLGCPTSERVVAIVQDRNTYLKSTGAAEWSGGWYDGRIHIAWTNEKEVGPQMRRGLAHELVHACLTSIPSGATPWPAWLQEGLAQKLSGDKLDPATRDGLRQHTQSHQIPRLEELHPDWSAMSVDQARQAYSLSLAAADALVETYPGGALRNVLTNPDSLPQITAQLDKKLGF